MAATVIGRLPEGLHTQASRVIGWGDILLGVGRNFANDRIPGRAAQMSFYFFLSVFPMLLILMAALGLFLDTQSLLRDTLMQRLAPLVPQSILRVFSDLLEHLAERSGAPLTWSIAIALWAASSGMVVTIGGFNQAYEVAEVRPWWKRRLVGLALTLVLMMVMAVVMVLMTYGVPLAETLAQHLGLDATFLLAWRIVQWPLMFGFAVLAFDLLYHFGPGREAVRWRWFPAGTVIAIGLWMAATIALKVYVTRIGSYSVAYGALGGVIVLLLWFYLTAIAILAGADINAQRERGARDDPPEPDAAK